jgi:uncharacterized protein (TIRG00374 family)
VKRTIINILKVAVVGFLVFYLVRYVGPRMNFEYLEEKVGSIRSRWPYLVLAQVFLGSILFITFYRWKLLLDAQGIRYSVREACAIGLIGYFFNQFLIGSTGGDIMKAYYVAVDHPERRAAGITTVFIDRVVGLLDLFVLAGIAILLNWSRIMADPWLRGLSILVAAILAGSLVGGALFFSERVRSSSLVRSLFRLLPFRGVLDKVQAAVYVYKFHPHIVVAAVLLSFVVQTSVILMVICYALALDLGTDLASFFFIVPLASLATALPMGSPGGLGQLEGAYSGLFFCFGFAERNGLILALVQRLFQYAWSLLGVYCYLRRKGRVLEARRLAIEGEAEEAGETAPAGPDREPRPSTVR